MNIIFNIENFDLLFIYKGYFIFKRMISREDIVSFKVICIMLFFVNFVMYLKEIDLENYKIYIFLIVS